MKRKIRRKCKCGCNRIVKLGNKYINGHNKPMLDKQLSKKAKLNMSLAATNREKPSKKTRLKMSLAHKGIKLSKEHKRKLSLSKMGNTHTLGYKQSKEHILNNTLAQIKRSKSNYEYCEIWLDTEYLKDIRKDYCENIDCKGIYKLLDNHHIYLDKKRCTPSDVMTLCHSCHTILHNQLGRKTNPKDYIIINRPDHVSYIHKASREVIKIIKRQEN